MSARFNLRPYRPDDEDAAITLWQQTWQQAYPAIDFAARVTWWRERWRDELVPKAHIVVAERDNTLIGFVTIDTSGYLDQLVVAPDHWGSELATSLVDEAKRLELIDIVIKEGARDKLETQRTSDRLAMTAATVARVLGPLGSSR